MNRNTLKSLVAIGALLGVSVGALASMTIGARGGMHRFKAGDPARAEDVNANFDYLDLGLANVVSESSQHDRRLSSLQSRVDRIEPQAALAWGTVDEAGRVLTGSRNFQVSRNREGAYIIAVRGEVLDEGLNAAIVTSLDSQDPYLAVAAFDDGQLYVGMIEPWKERDQLRAATFSFVIHGSR